MTNEAQKKLLQEIKDSVFDVQKRMNKIIELLTILVEENTSEKEARKSMIDTLKESKHHGNSNNDSGGNNDNNSNP